VVDRFDEPIVQLIERLKSEHRIFESKIAEIHDTIINNNIVHAIETIRKMTNSDSSHSRRRNQTYARYYAKYKR